MSRFPDPARRRLWRDRMNRFGRSELSIVEFCERERVSTASFYQWRKKLEADSRSAAQASAPAFVPLVLTDTLTQKPATLWLPGGASVELPASLGREQLTEILAACIAASAESPQ